MTLAYVQALQYWAEEDILPTPSDPCPLAMSERELRQHIGKYTTFSEHDVFEGLGNAVPEAKDGDTGVPPADSTTSPATTDIRDTQLSPTETQLADDTISLSPRYKPEAEDKDRGLHQHIPPPHLPWLTLKIPSLILWKLNLQMTPQYQQPNPMPRSRRTCQPPWVLVLVNWKVWLPPCHVSG